MIFPVGASFIAPSARPAARPPAAEFRVPNNATAPHAADQTAAATPASLGSLLGLQEFAAGEQERQALRHGHALLAKLSRLQQAILSGQGDSAALAELAGLAATPLETGDPRLRALIGSVLLRAKIELAKRGH